MAYNFPPDATDGTIVEIEPGLYYIYDSSVKSWNKLSGDREYNLATVDSAGLMSVDDYNIVNSVHVPPVVSTLGICGSDIYYSSGSISIFGGDQTITDDVDDQIIHFEGSAKLVNGVDGANTEEIVNRDGYGYTSMFDVFIDVDKVYDYLLDRGHFKVVAEKGDKGAKGAEGAPGKDKLLHGVKGNKGVDGANSPASFTMSGETIGFSNTESDYKAIIDITTNEVNDSENYLVVKRGKIGNPSAAPDTMQLSSDTNSSWVVAIPGDISNVDVTISDLACGSYAGPVFYLDINPILTSIKDEFELEARLLKESMEKTVAWWITVMAGKFDDQKAALCCALEYCKSQHRNTSTRRYIEQSRINAAMSGSSLIVDSDPKSGSTSCDLSLTVMQSIHTGSNGFGTLNDNGLYNNADPIGATGCVPLLTTINDVPFSFDECPPGFTPRSVLRNVRSSKITGGYWSGGLYPSVSGNSGNQVSAGNPQTPFVVLSQNSDDDKINDGVLFLKSSNSDDTEVIDQIKSIAKPIEVDPITLEFHIIKTNKSADQDLYIEGFGRAKKTEYETSRGGILTKYNIVVDPGAYDVVIDNRDGFPFDFRIATQNAVVIGGGGKWWRNDVINYEPSYDGDVKYGIKTCVKYDNKDYGKVSIRIRVPPRIPLYEPYSVGCGSVGPQVSTIDDRICKELPAYYGFPASRKNGDSSDPSMQEWFTSKIGKKLLPDSVSISIGGEIGQIGDLMLCRISNSTFSGGVNFNGKSAQIILEQINAINVPKESPINPPTIVRATNNENGPYQFRCTILMWNDVDCVGRAHKHSSVVVDSDGDDLLLSGSWDGFDGKMPFVAKASEIDYTNLEKSDDVTNISVSINNLSHGSYKRSYGELPAGEYYVSISSCCVKYANEYHGHINVGYLSEDGQTFSRMNGVGSFKTSKEAEAAYVGSSLLIKHVGGQVYVELANKVIGEISGDIIVTFRRNDDKQSSYVVDSHNHEYVMHHKQLSWLNEQWNNGNYVGCVMEIAGQDYIIITTIDAPQHISAMINGTAMAWPTLDGVSMVGLPSSGSSGFIRDVDLESIFVKNLQEGKFKKLNGDVKTIESILFPTI